MGVSQADILSDEQRDLARFNLLFAQSRVRALIALIALIVALAVLDIGNVRTGFVLLICATGLLVSWMVLRSDVGARAPRAVFYAQTVYDLAAVTLGVGFGVSGFTALLLRGLFVLLIVPPSLVSVNAGLVTTAAASIAHEVLLLNEYGWTLRNFAGLASTLPVFTFFIVAQQCFFYAGHLKEKNEKLARLAARLTNSQRRLGGLVRVAQTLNSTLEEGDLLSRLNAAALEELNADWAGTFIIDAHDGSFRTVAISEELVPFARAADTAYPLSAWPVLERLRNERVIAFESSDVRSPPLASGGGIEHFLSAGLYREDEVIGFLSVGYFGGNQEAASAAFEQLAAIAENATMALRNSQLLEEARQASRLKSDFLSTISHELRTPLNVMIGYAEMLREGAAGELTPRQLEIFERIDAQAHDLYDLIEATLQVGRMETGRDETRYSYIPLSHLLASLQSVTAQLPRPEAVDFAWDVAPDLSGTLHSDLGKVNLILRNLVSNAFKFTRSGRVTVRIDADSEHLILQVADTGIGIPPDDCQKIFEMFRQLHSETTRTHGGVGLGLYIVNQMVERLGGTVEVTSEVGRGSTFTVRLGGYRAVHAHASRGAA